MTQGVSEDLSLTADRCRGKTSGLSTSPCCPVSRATLWVLVPFSVYMNFQWTEMQWYKIISPTHCSLGFLGGAGSKEPTCQRTRHSRHGFDPSVRKIPQRRAWQPTLVFLHGESHGQRSWEGYSLNVAHAPTVAQHERHTLHLLVTAKIFLLFSLIRRTRFHLLKTHRTCSLPIS